MMAVTEIPVERGERKAPGGRVMFENKYVYRATTGVLCKK